MPKPVLRVLDVGGLSVRAHSSVQRPDATEGPTFVLVHGIGMSHRYFGRLHTLLAAAGTVHAIDLPGFGANPRPRRDLSVEDNAAVLAGALDGLGVRGAVVIGHSMGAQFVVDLAVQRPDLVSHAVLLGPVTDVARRSALQQAIRLGVDTVGESPRINAIVFTDYLRCGIRWYSRQLRPMLTYPIENRIADVGCPVLVVRGAHDHIALPEWCEVLAEGARDGVARSLPAGHHVVQESHPDLVADAGHHVVQESHPDLVADAVLQFAGRAARTR